MISGLGICRILRRIKNFVMTYYIKSSLRNKMGRATKLLLKILRGVSDKLGDQPDDAL